MKYRFLLLPFMPNSSWKKSCRIHFNYIKMDLFTAAIILILSLSCSLSIADANTRKSVSLTVFVRSHKMKPIQGAQIAVRSEIFQESWGARSEIWKLNANTGSSGRVCISKRGLTGSGNETEAWLPCFRRCELEITVSAPGWKTLVTHGKLDCQNAHPQIFVSLSPGHGVVRSYADGSGYFVFINGEKRQFRSKEDIVDAGVRLLGILEFKDRAHYMSLVQKAVRGALLKAGSSSIGNPKSTTCSVKISYGEDGTISLKNIKYPERGVELEKPDADPIAPYRESQKEIQKKTDLKVDSLGFDFE